MSRTFSTHCGSVESLNVSVRCGCGENARHMRCTKEAETPDSFAMSRVLQCVAPVGFSSSVLTTMASIWSSPILRGAPHRGSSQRPARRCLANRSRHVRTVWRDADLGGDRAIVEPVGGEQHDVRALRIPTCDLAPSNQTVKIGAFLTAERDDTRLRCPPRSHDGLRHSRHSLPNHSRAEMARNF